MATKNKQARRRSRAQVRADAERSKRRKVFILGGGIALAAIVAIGLILANRDSGSLPALQSVEAAELDSIPSDGRVLGDPDAPIHLIEYGDYQCPACAVFEQQVFPELVSDYIATGKVRFEFRDLAFLGDESMTAANAAACAIPQDGFWAYHKVIYGNHHGENLGNLSEKRLLEMAELAGLDAGQIGDCLDEGTTTAEVQAMRQEAASLGLSSTPSFVLNGTVIPWQGWDAMKQAIDAALAE